MCGSLFLILTEDLEGHHTSFSLFLILLYRDLGSSQVKMGIVLKFSAQIELAIYQKISACI